MPRFLPGVLLALALSPVAAFAQSFAITPANPVLAGDPLTLRLVGLPANAEVRIVAERAVAQPWMPGAKPVLYRSEATFATGADGTLDLASAKPKSGSYKNADIRGLFWSMNPTRDDAGERKTGDVHLTAHAQGMPVATAKVEFINRLPAVKVEKVEKFPGSVFATLPGEQKRPALIVLGGSEGGSTVAREFAPMLASRGFAVLGLPYYSPLPFTGGKAELPELPASFADIPVERLQEAFEWLKARPDVDATRIALHGTSKGAEFALIAGSEFGWIKAIAALVPTDVVWEGWGPGVEPGKRASYALRGKPLPFVPYVDFMQEFAGFQTGTAVHVRRPQDKGRAAHPAAAVKARIPVEKFKGPLMVIGGQDDQVWASGMMAHNIAEKRAEHGLETVSLIYSDAGHGLTGNGWTPTTQMNAGPMKMGGTPEGNARAQGDAFPKTIAFLKRALHVD
ncbi:MAG: acyl-CoA thioesterase/BAAT N-terminal domain-containing protein [Betaproteobacteria bacterium]|nr:acyl-CoA thioesterase/BAAT N-terminal domain-containing protein [Betaproteobacteria bacterium]